MKLARLFAVLIFCCFSLVTNAQDEFTFKRLGFKEGLPQSTIQAIMQDKDGFMWFATQDGLIRYDGYNFISYRPDPENKGSIANGYILDIAEDISGKYLWVSHRSGLSRFEKATGVFENYQPAKETFYQFIAICVDEKGKIWYTGKFGLRSFLPEDWQKRNSKDFSRIHFSGKDTALSHDVSYIRNATKGVLLMLAGEQLWAKDEKDGFNCICPKVEAKTISENQYGARMSDFYKGEIFLLNVITVINDTFLSNRKIKVKSTHAVRKDLPGLYYGLKDANGDVWLGGLSGINFLPGGIESEINKKINHDPGIPESISAEVVQCMYEDRSGLIWLGTSNGGLNIYNPRSNVFKHLTDHKTKQWHLNNKYIFGVTEDKYGDIWVGSMKGLHHISINKNLPDNYFDNITGVKLYLNDPNNPHSLSNDKISKLYASGDSLLISTMGGGFNILNIKTEKFTVFKHDKNDSSGIHANFVQGILKDREKRIWVFTSNGPSLLNTSTNNFEAVPVKWPEPVAKYNATMTGLHDSKGMYWFALSDGVSRYDPATQKMDLFLHNEKDKNSISFGTASEVYEDRAGNLWICTLGGGLNLYDRTQNSFTAFTERDGLSNNSIFGILEDAHGNLWMSTNKGIAMFNPSKRQFRNYGIEDGMPFSEFAQHSFWKAHNGWMFFGGEDGIVCFDPEEVIKMQHEAPVRLLDLKINYKSVGEGWQGTTLAELKHIDLYQEQKVISFEFGALGYTNASKYKYAYKLDGLDSEWHYTDSRHRFVTYTNLPFGHYAFIVKSTDDFGNWTNTPLRIELWVIPPFYYTWWFITLVVVFILILIIVTVSFIARFRLRRKLEKLELAHGLQTERERISRELHDSVGSQLTYIISTLDNTRKKATDSPVQTEIENNLENIGQFARESMQQLRESIWAMNKDSFTLAEFEIKLKDYIGKYLDTTGMGWDIDVSATKPVNLSPAHVLHLFRIIQEAVQNTIKHADATFIIITIHADAKSLKLTITDNGKGIQEAVAGDETSHYGLANMKKRAKDIHAELDIVSSKGGGTSVKLKMDLTKQ